MPLLGVELIHVCYFALFVGPSVSSTSGAVISGATTIVADGSSTTTLTVTLKDVNGNAVYDSNVTLDDSGSNATITPASTITGGSGVATFTLTASTLYEVVTYTVRDTSDGITLSQNPVVTFEPGAYSALSLCMHAACC